MIIPIVIMIMMVMTINVLGVHEIPRNCWGFLRSEDHNVYAQVLETLLEMRTQRMGLIQTEDQLRFSVEALILALKRLQGEVSGHLVVAVKDKFYHHEIGWKEMR